MKTQLIIIALLVVLATSGTGMAQTQDLYQKFANIPVPVVNRTGGANAQLYMIGTNRGEIIFRFEPTAREEITIPLDTPGLYIFFNTPRTYSGHVSMIRSRQYDDVVEAMRPYTYPLIKFADIPSNNINIHPIIDNFALALSRSSYLDEAVDVFNRLPLDKLDPRFVDHALFVVDRLAEDDRMDDAIKLLDQLPLSGDRAAQMLPRLYQFANSQREQGNIKSALFLYERLKDLPDNPQRDEAILWAAYCNLEMGKPQTALLFVELVGPIKPDQRAFSLERLVSGRIDMEADRPLDAMRKISHGVVTADIADPWMPELLYRSGELYQKLKQPDVAREVYGEVDLLFSSSSWGQRSRRALARLRR
ncbi:MAG: CDC27 family protein [Verrucomicrobiota bacterium]